MSIVAYKVETFTGHHNILTDRFNTLMEFVTVKEAKQFIEIHKPKWGLFAPHSEVRYKHIKGNNVKDLILSKYAGKEEPIDVLYDTDERVRRFVCNQYSYQKLLERGAGFINYKDDFVEFKPDETLEERIEKHLHSDDNYLRPNLTEYDCSGKWFTSHIKVSKVGNKYLIVDFVDYVDL